jgi:hypothetical protein
MKNFSSLLRRSVPYREKLMLGRKLQTSRRSLGLVPASRILPLLKRRLPSRKNSRNSHLCPDNFSSRHLNPLHQPRTSLSSPKRKQRNREERINSRERKTL